MPAHSDNLELLLVHADTNTPILQEGLAVGSAAEHARAPSEVHEPLDFWEEGGDPNDLGAQRWGLILPEGPRGDRLRELIRPLIALRREQQGGHPIKEYRVPSGPMTMAAAAQWRQMLEASALADRPFLPGGLWFYLACFGAGTPSRSAFHTWLSRLRDAGQFGGQLDRVLASLPREGERPFVAALPKVVLANPQGPLAVVGHMDLADLTQRAHLWMLRQDLAGYVLLGDPAVHLPVSTAQARKVAQPTSAQALAVSFFGMPVAASEPLPRAGKMAEAVLALLSGTASPRDLANGLGISLQQLRHWEQVYKDAGQAALERLRTRS